MRLQVALGAGEKRRSEDMRECRRGCGGSELKRGVRTKERAGHKASETDIYGLPSGGRVTGTGS
eukprot:3923573-Rhodomonas_salina.1